MLWTIGVWSSCIHVTDLAFEFYLALMCCFERASDFFFLLSKNGASIMTFLGDEGKTSGIDA